MVASAGGCWVTWTITTTGRDCVCEEVMKEDIQVTVRQRGRGGGEKHKHWFVPARQGKERKDWVGLGTDNTQVLASLLFLTSLLSLWTAQCIRP